MLILTFDQGVQEIIDRAGGRNDAPDRVVDALNAAQYILAQCDVEMPRLELQRAWRTQQYRSEYLLGRDLGINSCIGIRLVTLMSTDSTKGLEILNLSAAPDGGQRAINLADLMNWLGEPLSREVTLVPNGTSVPDTERTYFTEDMATDDTPKVPEHPTQMPGDPPGTTTLSTVTGIPLQDEYQLMQLGTTPLPRDTNKIKMSRLRWRDYRQLSGQSRSAPVQWTRNGELLALDPRPDSAYPVLVDYRREPLLSVWETPPAHTETLLRLGLHNFWLAQQEYEQAGAVFKMLPLMIQRKLQNPQDMAEWEAAWDDELGFSPESPGWL